MPCGSPTLAERPHKSIGRISTAGSLSHFTDPTIEEPTGITAGPDGALWFTNDRQQLDRPDHHAGAVSNYTDPSIDGARSDHGRSRRRPVVHQTNEGNGGSIGRITTAGAVTNSPGLSRQSAGHHDRAGRRPVVCQLRQQLDRADHYFGGCLRLHGHRHQPPYGITLGPDGALWFTNLGTNSIGRITTSGVVSNFTDPTISEPDWITVGPDGALWFTNFGNNSIGRITTSGVVSNFTDPSISGPNGITAGPDGNLWFTNSNTNSIGRITTSGVVTNYPVAGVNEVGGITAGPDGALWFTSVGSVGRITTAGVVTLYADDGSFGGQMTAGPDGALSFRVPVAWFALQLRES